MAKATETYHSILKNIKQGQIAPFYLLYGEETYYIDLISKHIQEELLDESAREFDLTIVYGKDLPSITPVIETARQFPMMGQRQVVVVREAQLIKDWSGLEAYAKHPQPTTVLCICYKYGKPDMRRAAFKEIAARGVSGMFQKLKDYEVAPWILTYARQHQVEMTSGTPELLAEYLGSDLQRIVNEMDKLIVGMPPGQHKITPELIERNIGISKDYNVFELQDALIQGDVLRCNRIIRYFDDNPKQNPLESILGSLFFFFSNLMIYHYINDKRENNVSQILGINPNQVKNYAAAARRFNQWKTLHTITWLTEADARKKGLDYTNGSVGILQELVYKILH
ncbi:MAG: DNA polymerase III subunit delta [Paludibacteraceae bacterium]|nr:DNA polymerase III subunit delta [Paludibacteraceae bacterium]